MNVLVTGAGGFIGSTLVPILLAAGHQVTVLDTWRHGPTLAAVAYDPNLEIVAGDVRHRNTLVACLEGVDVVIPLAAIVGAPACNRDPQGAADTNYKAVRTLCELARPDQLIVYPNTNSGYGSTLGTATEETPLKPLSHYAFTKTDGEAAVLDHGGISLRLGTVYGASPRMRLDLLVNDFTFRALRDRSLTLFDPAARRDYVHVRDVTSAFLHALDGHLTPGVYNIASENFTKEELCRQIAATLAPRPFRWHIGEGHDPDQRDYLVSTEKVRAAGWEPRYTVADGVRELAQILPTLQPYYGNV